MAQRPHPLRRRLLLTGPPLSVAAIAGSGSVAGAAGAAEAAQAAPPSTAWKLGGNGGVATNGSNFLGPTNVAPLVFKTRAGRSAPLKERLRIQPNGWVGIGTDRPTASQVHIVGRGAPAGLSVDNYAAGDGAIAGVFDAGEGTGVQGYGRTSGVEGVGGIGVTGQGSAFGVKGVSNAGVGVFGEGGTYAAYFTNDVLVLGTVISDGLRTRIDHPADPERRWLTHGGVDAPQPLTVYRGTATLDATGAATVRLPAYAAALGRDPHHQLTAVGGAMPDLHVAWAKADRFAIAGGRGGLRVCWQVTLERADDATRDQPIVNETPKTGADVGTRVHVPAGSGARPAPRLPTGRPPEQSRRG